MHWLTGKRQCNNSVYLQIESWHQRLIFWVVPPPIGPDWARSTSKPPSDTRASTGEGDMPPAVPHSHTDKLPLRFQEKPPLTASLKADDDLVLLLMPMLLFIFAWIVPWILTTLGDGQASIAFGPDIHGTPWRRSPDTFSVQPGSHCIQMSNHLHPFHGFFDSFPFPIHIHHNGFHRGLKTWRISETNAFISSHSVVLMMGWQDYTGILVLLQRNLACNSVKYIPLIFKNHLQDGNVTFLMSTRGRYKPGILGYRALKLVKSPTFH